MLLRLPCTFASGANRAVILMKLQPSTAVGHTRPSRLRLCLSFAFVPLSFRLVLLRSFHPRCSLGYLWLVPTVCQSMRIPAVPCRFDHGVTGKPKFNNFHHKSAVSSDCLVVHFHISTRLKKSDSSEAK